MSPIPTVPGALPLLGHTARLAAGPLAFLEAQRRQGDITRIRLGRRPAYLLNHPGLVRALLTAPTRQFDRGDIFREGRGLLGEGLAVADGEHHLTRRRTVQPLFQKSRLPDHFPAMAEHATARARSWRAGQRFALNAEMTDLALTVISHTLFGAPLSDHDLRTIRRHLPGFFQGVAYRGYGPRALLDGVPTPERARYRAAVTTLRAMFEKLVAAHRDSPALAAIGEGADEAQLVDDVASLVTGAHTTASTAAWVFHLLDRHPDVRARVREEADTVVGDRDVRPDDIPRLTYTGHVLTETLRYYPPVWLFPRRATVPVTLGGHEFPAGTQLFYSPYVIHRDPRFHPRPTVFDPGRWTGARAGASPHRTAYLPFGAGVHGCPGGDYALAELVLLVAAVGRRWHLRPDARAVPRPRTILAPSPVTVTVEPRAAARTV
ncbi:cytochrome P450 [Streptomyces daliensis]